MISFRCKTKYFKETLDLLKALYKKKNIYLIQDTCEITLTDSNVKLAIPGSVFSFNCQTKGTAKATILFRNLYSIIEHHYSEEIFVEFYDESLKFGSVQVKAKTVFFKNDRILRTIILPNNYTDLDLLLLKNDGYTTEELDFNNLTGAIEMAERRVYYNIRRAANYLREYGIMPKEIKAFVVERLKIKLDLDERDLSLLLDKM